MKLDQRDLDVLGKYAREGNRELYWNYLAQHPGSDGYALLALGVVRNDNAPGAVANAFASNHARTISGRHLSEREWEAFGQDLVARDFALREAYVVKRHRPDLALNLPVKDVQTAHDEAFRDARIDENAWTPRELLEAARRHGGEPEAQKVWSQLLDNSNRGLDRLVATSTNIALHYNDGGLDASDYLRRMGVARVEAADASPNTNPDRIGSDRFYYRYAPASRSWSAVTVTVEGVEVRAVEDRRLREQLDDTRELRLERQHKRTQFHPLDSHRAIIASPDVVADQAPARGSRPEAMSAHAEPARPAFLLHEQCRAGVHRLDATLGRIPDADSERVAASLARLAVERGLTHVDHVVLSRDSGRVRSGENIFVVQGGLDDPAHHVAHMRTEQARTTPVEQSLQAIEQARASTPEVTQPRLSPTEASRHVPTMA